MIPAKFKALILDSSEESSDSSDSLKVTREALEQQAITKYQLALEYESNESWDKAESMLRELLKSQMLNQHLEKPTNNGNVQSTMFHLKYCVTKNLGNCLAKQGKLENSLKYYLKASRQDPNDLNLWFRIGNTACLVPDLYLAASAFEEGLRCSPNHWPCVDSIITVYYAIGDFMSCLHFVHKGLQMDKGFLKGHAFKEKIFSQSPSLIEDFKLFYPECKLIVTPPEIDLNGDKVKEMFKVADLLKEKARGKAREKFYKKLKEEDSLTPEVPVLLDSWISIYKCLLYLYDKADNEVREKNMFRPVRLNVDTSDETPIDIQVEDSDTELEDSDNNKASDEMDDDENGKGRNGNIMEKLLSCQNQKRRSARVRSTIRREEPCIANTFAKLIPTNLLPKDYKKEADGWSEDSMHTMDLYRLYKEDEEAKLVKTAVSKQEREQLIKEENYFNTQNELSDVVEFVKFIDSNKVNIIDSFKYANLKLAEKWKLHWPDELSKYFIRVSLLYFQYNPVAMKSSMEPNSLAEDLSILLFGELLLNQWLIKGKQQGALSPLGNTLLGGEFSSLFLGSLNNRAYDTNDMDFVLRSYWLEALLLFYSGDTVGAARALQQVIYDERCEEAQACVPNVSKHTMINKGVVVKLLKSFKRNKRLEQVMDLYHNGYYEEVTDTLADSLNAEEAETDDEIISRPMQYSLILDSYWRLANHKECVYWSEQCLHETLALYRNATDEERPAIASMIVSILQGVTSCVDNVGCSVFQTMPTDKLTRLIQTLRAIINHQMEAAENSTEMPIESVAPWIILYYIIKSEEELKENGILKRLEGEEEESLPASLQMLFMGHEYLGRRSWCCFDEGSLLFHTLKILYPIIQTLPPESTNYIKITQQVDQVFYCLYGQQKKIKARHIVDHNVMGLAITWNRAQQMFLFSRPKELPSYDSTGKCCVSADMECLYLKLIEYVPPEFNPERLTTEMSKYIDGQLSYVPRNDKPLPEDFTDIYYLLGHFYFKSKSWSKALKYFLMDICANPTRVDSWACLALARGSLIESKLNSCDTIKNELEFLSTASMVCKSYERALELDPGQCTLWIERGTFSYTIHSFCSNALKKEQNLSIEMYSVLEKHKDSMLNAAKFCFSSANKIWYGVNGRDLQDERWLHHYMLGKIAKKQDADIGVVIGHYIKSAELLHEIGASYPSTINYSSPQFLSIEALELYYRVHASILKTFEEYEDKSLSEATVKVFKTAINTLSQCPFVRQVKTLTRLEKSTKQKKNDSPSDDEDMTVSKDVQDMLQDLMVRVDNSGAESLSNQPRGSSSSSDEYEPPKKVNIVEDASSDTNNKVYPVRRSSSDSTSEPSKSCAENVEVRSEKGGSSSSCSKSNKSSNSSSSDSSSDTSSNSSSSSSSSSDSDSSSSDTENESNDEAEPESKKMKPCETLLAEEWKKDCEWIIEKCLSALELCRKRFSQHYKTMYHLAHFYFKSKTYKDTNKVREILLGPNGLFHDRKPSNFFNGLWRIPSNEVDRPGSFAAHMGRSVLLLIDFLRECKDYAMLIDLSLQLKSIPEADKKYLRDNERDELCKEAAILCGQCVRKKMQEVSGDEVKELLFDVYYIHKKVVKNNFRESTFAGILSEIYSKYSQKNESGPMLDAAIRFCQQEISFQKQQQQLQLQLQQQSSAAATASAPPTPSSASSSVVKPLNLSENTPIPSAAISEVNPTVRQRGSGRTNAPGRKPRGRPPNSSLGPRMPTPRASDITQMMKNMPSLLLYQNELLLRQLAMNNPELNRQLASMTTQSNPSLPLLPPFKFPSEFPSSSSSGITSAAQQSQAKTVEVSQVSPPILKDRPSLSITPIKPNSPSSSSSKGNINPISVSVTKFSNKSSSKHSGGSGGSTHSGKNNQSHRKSSVVNLPPHPLTNAQSRPSNLMFNPALSTSISQLSQAHKSVPPIFSTKSLSVSPITPPPTVNLQSSKKMPPVSVSVINPSLSITSKSGPSSTSSFDTINKTHQTMSPTNLTTTKSQEPSLQHKILSAKKMSYQNANKKNETVNESKSIISTKPLIQSNDVTIPGGLTINRSPTKQTSYSQLNVQQGRNPAAPKTAGGILDSLTITPSTTKMEPYSKNTSSRSKIDDKLKLFSKVPNLDSTVADALRNFGSSITITTSNPKNIKSDSSAQSQNSKSKDKSKDKKEPYELIVLDD